jgi:type IV pilus assembly protein PilM
MPFPRNAVAIDLGAHAIKAVEVTVSASGIHVLRALRLERAALAEKGVAPGDNAALAKHLREALQLARIPMKQVVLGIGGQDAMYRYTRIPPVPAWRLKAIMTYEVTEYAEKIGEPLASDYRPLQLAREADEDQTILIGLAKEKYLEELLSTFEAEGIVVEKAVPSALALFSAQDAFGRKAPEDSPDDDVVLLADLGAEQLSMALVLNGRLAFARTSSVGGRTFTEALARAMGIGPKEAERLKVTRGGLDDRDRTVHHDTVPPLRNAAGQVLGALQSSLKFASTQIGTAVPPLTRAVLLGGGARLRGLPELIATTLGKPVESFQPAGLQLADSLPEPMSRALRTTPGEFGVVLGLGAARLRETRGAESSRVISLLPAKYLKRREFKERTVFLYAAGALLALLLLGRLAHAIVESSSASGVHQRLTETHAALTAQKQEMDAASKQADRRRARLNRLLHEAEVTAFQAFVLEHLARVQRPEIQMTRIVLDAPTSEDGTTIDYNLRLEGRVNNEKRRGLEWLLDLQAALKAEDRIGSVEVESSRPDGAWYTFELSVRPNYVSY